MKGWELTASQSVQWCNISISLIFPKDRAPVSKCGEAPVRRWGGIFAVAGGVWMILVLRFGSLPLARLSNYPGAFAARWVQYRGIGPSPALVFAFSVWLVLTSSIEWVVIRLALRVALRRLLKLGILDWLA